jgi:glycosyltransferase involved in cell wall biosynthesis
MSNAPQPKISCFIVCCNEEHHIGRCIGSVAKWCSEVVVIDSGSTDRTVEIARDLGARVIHERWRGFVEQKRLGLSHCSGDWVLNLDADEEVSPELAGEIVTVLGQAGGDVSGYELNRVVFFLGRWWRVGGWYPEYRLRLVRRDCAAWGGTNPHEHAVTKSGETARLTGELRHYTYEDFADQIKSLNAHSSTAAQSLIAAGYKATLADLLFRPIARFVKFYLTKGGYKEGAAGFIVGVHEAVYVFLKYSKVWEAGLRGAAPGIKR